MTPIACEHRPQPTPPRHSAPRGFTLLELVVVLLILAVLASLALGVLPSMVKRAHLAKCATTIPELNRIWMRSFATNVRYPDVLDSLLTEAEPATSLTPGLLNQINPLTLSGDDVAALRSIGVTRVIDLVDVDLTQNATYDAAANGAPTRLLADGGVVAQLDLASHVAAGNALNLKRHLTREGNVKPGVRYLIFGVGPNCTAVGPGRMLQEAPVHFAADDTLNPTTVYQRYLIVMSLEETPSGLVANFETSAGNDLGGPSSADDHVRQYHEEASRDN